MAPAGGQARGIHHGFSWRELSDLCDQFLGEVQSLGLTDLDLDEEDSCDPMATLLAVKEKLVEEMDQTKRKFLSAHWPGGG